MLEGDFDPDKFDAAMAAAFDNNYYDEAIDDDENELLHDETAELEARKVADAPDSFALTRKQLLQQSRALDYAFGHATLGGANAGDGAVDNTQKGILS